MTKKIILVTQATSTGPTYVEWLTYFFGASIDLKQFSVEQRDFEEIPQDADLYIVAATSSDAFSQVVSLIPPGDSRNTGEPQCSDGD